MRIATVVHSLASFLPQKTMNNTEARKFETNKKEYQETYVRMYDKL